MSAFVLDCSVAVAWLFDDEATPATDSLLDRLKDSGALVPSLWRLELGNVLSRAERHRRISAAHIARQSRSTVRRWPVKVLSKPLMGTASGSNGS